VEARAVITEWAADREFRTFNKYQAWLTRPDLDPAEFASGEVAS